MDAIISAQNAEARTLLGDVAQTGRDSGSTSLVPLAPAVQSIPLTDNNQGQPGLDPDMMQAITEHFKKFGKQGWLLKAAYTGIAASLIGGKTTRSIAMVSRTEDRRISDGTRKKLQEFWAPCRYLIIDEISMISKRFLAIIERNISIGKAGCSAG